MSKSNYHRKYPFFCRFGEAEIYVDGIDANIAYERVQPCDIYMREIDYVYRIVSLGGFIEADANLLLGMLKTADESENYEVSDKIVKILQHLYVWRGV